MAKKQVPRPARGSATETKSGWAVKVLAFTGQRGVATGAGTGPHSPGGSGWEELLVQNTADPCLSALQKRAADTISVPWLSHQDPSAEACGRLWILGSSVRIPTQQQILPQLWECWEHRHGSGSRVSRRKRGIQNPWN